MQQINAEELEEMKGKGYNEQSVIGKSGLEKLYEDRLREKKGYRISILDEQGKEKQALAVKPAEDGENIKLNIDIRWQQKLYEAYQEDKSCSVVMNPKSGEVLALVSTPSYNSMDFVLGMSQETWDAVSYTHVDVYKRQHWYYHYRTVNCIRCGTVGSALCLLRCSTDCLCKETESSPLWIDCSRTWYFVHWNGNDERRYDASA